MVSLSSPAQDLTESEVYFGGAPQTETKFMQEFRVADPVHAGGEVVAVRNGHGQVEMFTVATNGVVRNIYDNGGSGYSMVETGLVGSSVAVGVDSAKQMIVFAVNQDNKLVLDYVRETGQEGGKRWTQKLSATVPFEGSPNEIKKICLQEIDGSLYVAVLTLISGNCFLMSYAIISADWDGRFIASGMVAASGGDPVYFNGVWFKNIVNQVVFQSYQGSQWRTYITIKNKVLGGTLVLPDGCKYMLSYDILPKFAVISPNFWEIYAICDDGNLYKFYLVSGAYVNTQITQNIQFKQVIVEEDTTGVIHLFALGKDSNLYHMTSINTIWKWTTPAILKINVRSMTVATNDSGNIELFLTGTGQDTLTHMVRSVETGDWETDTISLPASGPDHVESFISYSTDITLRDANGSPMPNAAFRLKASAEAEITINGIPHWVDPYNSVVLNANSHGLVSVIQQTDSLGAPSLEIELIGGKRDTKPFAIRQFAGVQNYLKGASTTDFVNAEYKIIKDGRYTGQTEYLLPQDYRNNNGKMFEPLRVGINNLMSLPSHVQLETTRLSKRANKPGAGWSERRHTEHLNRIRTPEQFVPWRLSFNGDSPVYEELTAEAAQAIIADMNSRRPDLGRIPFLSDIYDLVRGIAEGAYDLVSTAVIVISNGVSAVIEFTYQGFKYVFESVLNFFEKAFGVVEAIFQKVQATFEKVFAWVGTLFNWDEILLTRTAISHCAVEYLKFMEDATEEIQRKIDNGIAHAKDKIHSSIDEIIQNLQGKSIGKIVETDTPHVPQYDAAMANNSVANATLNNIDSAKASIAMLTDNNAGGFDDVTKAISELTAKAQANPAFAQAKQYMETLGSNPSEIFKQVLSALLEILKGLIDIVLDGVQAVIDALLKAFKTIIASLRVLITTPIKIPFVTDFYSWLTKGSELTFLDVTALIIAIPTNALYAVLSDDHKSPFAIPSDLTIFTSVINSKTMLAKFRGESISQSIEDSLSHDAKKTITLLLAITTAVGTAGYGILVAYLDSMPQNTPMPTYYPSVLACVFESIAQFCAFPLWPTVAPQSDKQIAANFLYWFTESGGIILDCYYTHKLHKLPENADNNGIWAGVCYGLIHCTVNGVNMFTYGGVSTLGFGSKLGLEVAALAKGLRFFKSPYYLIVQSIIDVVGFGAASILGLLDSGVMKITVSENLSFIEAEPRDEVISPLS